MNRETYARFWKCALQVNPEGYSRAYRGQDHGLTGQEFLGELLNACQTNGIEVIGIADHGSVQDVDAIRNYLSPHGIVVFPGFEVASSEKVHWVCLFSENTTTEQLHRYLGSLSLTNLEDRVRPSMLSGTELLRKVTEELGGFCYAAHVTNESGVLKRKANHLWVDPRLKAAQIPGTVDELPTEFQQIAKNQDLAYKRETVMAFINAKDVAKPSDLGIPTTCCFIKMTHPTFASFVTAFKDPESRVRRIEQMEDRHYSRIESLRINGGYLDGLEVNFSGHLETVIGGRGTGKSTMLECIRYALDCEHKGESARQYGNEIIKANLGASAGRIELELVSASNNMQSYKVIRRFGEPPRVEDAEGNVSTLHPRDLLPRVEIYGQNEIYELARDPVLQRRVIERFLPDEEGQQIRLKGLKRRLSENAAKLAQALSKQDELEFELAQLPKLNEQAVQFKALGVEERLRQVPLLEKERQFEPRIEEEVQRVELAAHVLRDSMPDLAFLSDKALGNLPHAEHLRYLRDVLGNLESETKKAFQQIQAAVKASREKLKQILEELNKALEEAEVLVEKEFASLPDLAGKRGSEIGRAYQNLLRQIERIQPQDAQLKTTRTLIEGLAQERRNLRAELSDLHGERTGALQREAKRLSKRLKGKMRIEVIAGGNRQELKEFLCQLPGISERRAAWVDDVSDLTIPALVDAINRGEEYLRDIGWGLTQAVAHILSGLSPAQIMDLESINLEDKIDLQLNVSHDGENYRSLDRLSTGQQCTAILQLLLLDNVDPLIMDQPEDNLDNAFIAERIVQELRGAKTERQFIFATHNANIPVFGDAEWIGVFSANGEHGEMPAEAQGSTDEPAIRDQVARILEGGRDAFVQRKAIYGY